VPVKVALSREDAELIEAVFMRGPSALLDMGLAPAEAEAFLQRPEVQQQIEILAHDFRHQDLAAARVRFGLKRRLQRMAPDALRVIEEALGGPRYVRNAQGQIVHGMYGPLISEPEPTTKQRSTAIDLLDRLGLTPESRDAKDKALPDLKVSLILQQEIEATNVEIQGSGTMEEQALSRERVRGVIEALASKLPSLREKYRLAPPAPKVRVKVKRVKPCPSE